MKFFHLSDLHIGKRVNEFSLLSDQRFILSQILDACDMEKPDGILIAGDIYDRNIPPADAVLLFDDFLTALAERGIAVFLISGNHDSAERLFFGARLLSDQKIFVSSVFDGTVPKIPLEDKFGTVWVHLLPFLKPAMVRHVFEEEADQITDTSSALEVVLRHMEIDPGERNVLVAHQFVTGAVSCDSEELSVGGVDAVSSSLLEAFDYVALGHLHTPQNVGKEQIRYAGSPLKYSFSEADQQKSVTVAELEKKGTAILRTIPLTPLHDMRKIRGTYLEITERSFYEKASPEDYLQVTLTDEEDIPDGLAKLRVFYPNIMRLEYDNQRTRQTQQMEAVREIEKKSVMEIFREFYELQNNQPMSKQQESYLAELIQEKKDEA